MRVFFKTCPLPKKLPYYFARKNKQQFYDNYFLMLILLRLNEYVHGILKYYCRKYTNKGDNIHKQLEKNTQKIGVKKKSKKSYDNKYRITNPIEI